MSERYYWQKDGQETVSRERFNPAVPLRIELINDSALRQIRQMSKLLGEGGYKSNSWVAEIIGKHDKYGFDRKFVRGHRDYSEADSTGNRGVYECFLLQPGKVYEVSERYSNKNIDRYFCVANKGEIVRLEKEEVISWLNLRSV